MKRGDQDTRGLEGRYEKASTEAPGRGEDDTRKCEGRNTGRRDAVGTIQSNDGNWPPIARNFSYDAPTILLSSPAALWYFGALEETGLAAERDAHVTQRLYRVLAGLGSMGTGELGRTRMQKKKKKKEM